MIRKRIAAMTAATILMLSMGATAMAGTVRPCDDNIVDWDRVPVGDISKLCIMEEEHTGEHGGTISGKGYIRFSSPENCGPWYYEDVEEDMKQAFGVQKLEDRGDYPRVVSSNDPPEIRDAWTLMHKDPTRTAITLSNGTQVAKPDNGVKLRPGETLYECKANCWRQIMPGDMNDSGTITISDLTQWVATLNQMNVWGVNSNEILRADLNGDKEITLSDLVMLANILVKGPNTRTFDGKPAATITDDTQEENLRMEYEPVYKTHRGDICWHCKADMILESEQTGKDLEVVRAEHGDTHKHEFLDGTAQRPNYFYVDENNGTMFIQGSFTAWITQQIDVVPAPAEAHERKEYICGVCDLNVTRELIDPEEHRMQHAQDDVEFGGIGFEFYRVETVWVPAA